MLLLLIQLIDLDSVVVLAAVILSWIRLWRIQVTGIDPPGRYCRQIGQVVFVSRLTPWQNFPIYPKPRNNSDRSPPYG